jgi:hypothetical protein
VTVGIGVLCQRGTTAVIASDLRTTYPQSAVDANDVTGKQWDFDVPFPVVACVAGKLGACQAVVDELNNRLRKLVIRNAPIHCEHIENAIREARARTFRRLADWSIRMAYGMTLREWQRGKVPGGTMSHGPAPRLDLRSPRVLSRPSAREPLWAPITLRRDETMLATGHILPFCANRPSSTVAKDLLRPPRSALILSKLGGLWPRLVN